MNKYFILALAIALSSCSDSFFEKEMPSNQVVSGKFYKDQSDFNLAVTACYEKLKSEVSFLLTEIEYRGDSNNLDAVAVSTQSRYDLDHFQDISTNTILASAWKNDYNGIFRCNEMLNRIDGVDFAKHDQYKAEAMTLRAWYHFNLYRTFGVVPIVRKAINPTEAMGVPRCAEDEMYEFLSSELKAAAEMLPDSYTGEEIGRITNCAANALLGRVALTFGKYEDAEKALAAAMKNTHFGLMGSTAEVFDVKNKQNREILLAVRYNKSVNLGHGAWYTTTNPSTAKNPTVQLTSAYESGDNRARLLEWTKMTVGNNYQLNKWYDTYDATYTTVTGNDFPLLRYADVVLMYAEAINELGRSSEALPYLNKTRERAGIKPLTISDASTKEQVRHEILDERQREFAYEGMRWFDLVRMGYAVDYFTSLGYTIDSHNLVMPIPNDQIEVVNNKSVMWQNPGYEN